MGSSFSSSDIISQTDELFQQLSNPLTVDKWVIDAGDTSCSGIYTSSAQQHDGEVDALLNPSGRIWSFVKMWKNDQLVHDDRTLYVFRHIGNPSRYRWVICRDGIKGILREAKPPKIKWDAEVRGNELPHSGGG